MQNLEWTCTVLHQIPLRRLRATGVHTGSPSDLQRWSRELPPDLQTWTISQTTSGLSTRSKLVSCICEWGTVKPQSQPSKKKRISRRVALDDGFVTTGTKLRYRLLRSYFLFPASACALLQTPKASSVT